MAVCVPESSKRPFKPSRAIVSFPLKRRSYSIESKARIAVQQLQILAGQQVRQHLCSKYGAFSPHSHRVCTSLGPRMAVNGVLFARFNLPIVSRELTHLVKRCVSSYRKNSAAPTPLSPKSPTTHAHPKADSSQSNVGRMFKRYFPRPPSAAIIYEEVRRISRRRMYLSAGAGAVAGMILVGAVTFSSSGEDRIPRTNGMLRSTWSILWGFVTDFRKKLVTLLGDGLRDVIEAGTSTAILARCLISVLLTVREEPQIGVSGSLKPGVTALVADLAAHENRRKAVLTAGGGSVVDWLLKAVGMAGARPCLVAQAEASRALAHLLSDESTCEGVLSRPHGLQYLLQFASSMHNSQGLQNGSKEQNHTDNDGSLGKRMLVTALMDLIRASCDVDDGIGLKPKLPGNADPGDIASALQVVKDGVWLSGGGDGNSAGNYVRDKRGVHGLGIKVMDCTDTVRMQKVKFINQLGEVFVSILPDRLIKSLQGAEMLQQLLNSPHQYTSKAFLSIDPSQSCELKKISPAVLSGPEYGLWNDLQGRYIAVQMASWALAKWAWASCENRAKIAELDRNGDVLLAAILAPEKTVKWHGIMAMRLLLTSSSYSHPHVAARWSSALLDVATQAGRLKDTSLAHSALVALTGCVSSSKSAHSLVLQRGLPAMREIANEAETDIHVQGALAQVLDLLTANGSQLPEDESKKWALILLKWVCSITSDTLVHSCGSQVLVRVINNLGLGGIPISQAWLATLLMEAVSDKKLGCAKGKQPANVIADMKEREQLQNQAIQVAIVAAAQLAKVVADACRAEISGTKDEVVGSAGQLPMIDLLGTDVMNNNSSPTASSELSPKVTASEAAQAVQIAVKALTELIAEDPTLRQRILESGVLCLLRRLLLCNDYEEWAASERAAISSLTSLVKQKEGEVSQTKGKDELDIEKSVCPHIRKHAARLLSILTLQPAASVALSGDKAWCKWLEDCANGEIGGSSDIKTRSYALTSLLNVFSAQLSLKKVQNSNYTGEAKVKEFWPRYEDAIFIMNSGSVMWRRKVSSNLEDQHGCETWKGEDKPRLRVDSAHLSHQGQSFILDGAEVSKETLKNDPVMDVVFIHGLRGGPFKSWQVAGNKTSVTTALVETIDIDMGIKGMCWPKEWLAVDLPRSRLLSVKYKTNLSEWSGATLPLQEVSSILLDKLLAAGVGERPLVFITHSMGGLVVKQMLLQAAGDDTRAHLVNHTTGVVFYSCPHFGSKLADVPWTIGYVLRPAPSIGDLRSGSPRLEELNNYLRQLHKERHLDVLSFSETQDTPLVEGYGGWGLRVEVVPIESAYPGFGELVILPGTDHVNSCKPVDQMDPAYTKTLEFLQNLESFVVGGAKQTNLKSFLSREDP